MFASSASRRIVKGIDRIDKTGTCLLVGGALLVAQPAAGLMINHWSDWHKEDLFPFDWVFQLFVNYFEDNR